MEESEGEEKIQGMQETIRALAEQRRKMREHHQQMMEHMGKQMMMGDEEARGTMMMRCPMMQSDATGKTEAEQEPDADDHSAHH